MFVVLFNLMLLYMFCFNFSHLLNQKPKVGDQHKLTENKADPDFDRNSSDPEFDRGCSSPENPPPSPINFTQSSMDGFVVGGKKLQCPKRTNIGMSYNVRI